MNEAEAPKDSEQLREESELVEERREFLKKCGRFAVYAAPAMAIVLAHSVKAPAGS